MMKNKVMIFIYFVLAINNTYAASYDCLKANTKIEGAICSDKNLSIKDEELSKIYKNLLESVSPQQAKTIKEEQKNWLISRNKNCLTNGTDVSVNCLVETYDSRIVKLKNGENTQLMNSDPTSVGSNRNSNITPNISSIDPKNENVMSEKNNNEKSEKQSGKTSNYEGSEPTYGKTSNYKIDKEETPDTPLNNPEKQNKTQSLLLSSQSISDLLKFISLVVIVYQFIILIKKGKNENKNIIQISDSEGSIKQFLIGSGSFMIAMYCVFCFLTSSYQMEWSLFFSILLVSFSFFCFRIAINHNIGVLINERLGTMEFPESRPANDISDYLSPTFLTQDIRRGKISLDSIQQLSSNDEVHFDKNNDPHYSYNISIQGTFPRGTAKIYLSETKRDRLYNIIRSYNSMGQPIKIV